jgi:hypothetical protein
MPRLKRDADDVEVSAIATVDGMQAIRITDYVHVVFTGRNKLMSVFLTPDQIRELRGMLDGAL